jgi:hypothetical protein
MAGAAEDYRLGRGPEFVLAAFSSLEEARHDDASSSHTMAVALG